MTTKTAADPHGSEHGRPGNPRWALSNIGPPGTAETSANGSVIVWTVSMIAGATEAAGAGVLRQAKAPPSQIKSENGTRNFNDAASHTA